MQTLSIGRATRNVRSGAGLVSGAVSLLREICDANWRPAVVLGVEILAAVASYAVCLTLLAQGRGRAWDHELQASELAFSAAAALIATISTQFYRRSIHYSNLLDVSTLAGAAAVNVACLAGFLSWDGDASYGIAPLLGLDAALLLLSWGLLHFGPRTLRAHLASRRKTGARAVIVGAGDAGLSLLKETALDRSSLYRPVAMADDDLRKWGRSLFGVPVLGGIRDLSRIASKTSAEVILVCIPSATHSQMHHILEACRGLNLPVRSLPSLPELIQSTAPKRISPRHLREPRIEHLLQRDEFQLDARRTSEMVKGKKVLVTGAGGSIGSELSRQIAAAHPEKLLLLDKSENSLFYINLETCERLDPDRVTPILADLSSAQRTRSILNRERPDLIFHAAAHKHVSMIELHPEEAIRNNVIGTRNLAEAALDFEVESFVNISTDKAVDPRNFMGLSKKITELCVQELARKASGSTHSTRFSNVRFGNVAGSTGSVIRLFWEQIQRGGPIRVTDPQASRYFMSVSEAVHLILGAAELGKNGETFVFEMGNPFNIYELARTMALFAGLRPHRDIAIEFTGLRTGEKLFEQLWDEWEHPVPTNSKRICAIREKDPRSRRILDVIAEMEQCLVRADSRGLMASVRELFPNFGEMRRAEQPTDSPFWAISNFAVAGPAGTA